MFRSGSSRMTRPSSMDLNAARTDDQRTGVKFVKESEAGSCVMIPQCFAPSMKSTPIKTVLYSERNGNLIWSDYSRFHIFDKQSGDTQRTPRHRLRKTIRCMVYEEIKGKEYLWTGHGSGEVCLWTQMGKLIGKPFTAAKTGITAMCLVRPGVMWVGGMSGNVRVVKLNTNSDPFEICWHTTVAPGLEPTSRALTVRPWIRSPHREPSLGLIESVPEGLAVTMAERTASTVTSSGLSFGNRMRERAQWSSSRAHSGNVRCIFAKGGRVWTSGGRYRYSVKLWDDASHRLECVFGLNLKGPCVSMSSLPWHPIGSSASSVGSAADWRLLTAHESGLMYLWDPSQRPLRQPLLEIETRKSPIKSLMIFDTLGLMCTAHKDGSLMVGRIISSNMRIHALSASEDDGQIYPFVPRTQTEDVFPGGLQTAISGQDSMFLVSTRGEIVHWPKEKLTTHLNVLQRSSSRRMPVQVVNESVMVIDKSRVTMGDLVYDGDFARVKRGKFMAKEVIVKEAKDGQVSRRAMDALVKDAHILSTIRHPNIVNIMAVCGDPPFVVMQYYEEGSLYDVLKRCRGDPRAAQRFTWEKRLKVAIDICCGMVFLHCQQPAILHRDLKSPNVFIEKDFTGGSVGDFNLSKETGPAYFSGTVRPSNPMWLAPEVAKGETDFTKASDIYAFGIVMWEIATARTPWDHLRTTPGMGRELFFGRIRYELFEHKRLPLARNEDGQLKNVSGGAFPQIEEYVRLMEACWAGKVEKRPDSFEEIIDSLEVIRKRYLEWNQSSMLARRSEGLNRAPSDLDENMVKRTTSEPHGFGSMRVNNVMPPKMPSTAKASLAEEIPQSPFDHQSGGDEDSKVTLQQEQGETEFPVSPFN